MFVYPQSKWWVCKKEMFQKSEHTLTWLTSHVIGCAFHVWLFERVFIFYLLAFPYNIFILGRYYCYADLLWTNINENVDGKPLLRIQYESTITYKRNTNSFRHCISCFITFETEHVCAFVSFLVHLDVNAHFQLEAGQDVFSRKCWNKQNENI